MNLAPAARTRPGVGTRPRSSGTSSSSVTDDAVIEWLLAGDPGHPLADDARRARLARRDLASGADADGRDGLGRRPACPPEARWRVAQGTVDRLDVDAPPARRLRPARRSSVRKGVARTSARSIHAARRRRRRRVHAQAGRSLPPRLLARAWRALPERRSAAAPAGSGGAVGAVRRRGMELPDAQSPGHTPRFLPHDLQRAREPSDRIRARSGAAEGVPRRRGASARVHARAPALPLGQDGRRHHASVSRI